MNFNFGTPARLERQIAQDLLASQSDFDLSVPEGDTRDISTSISRTPLGPSQKHNASFSRPSDDASSTSKRTYSQNQATPRQPVSLASAVRNAQQLARSVSSNSPTEEQMGGQPALSSSSSTSTLSDSPQSPNYKDPYGNVRSDSPPLTSTPQRTGPASTVGSRSRTTMTVRPINAAGNRTASSYQNDLTSASASHNMQSARSASAVLDDLTESSIAPEDVDDRQDGSAQNLGNTPAAGQDFVVYDARSREADASLVPETAVRWSQRRAERRRLVETNDSTVYDDDSVLPNDAAQYSSEQPHDVTMATQSLVTEAQEDTATAYSSPAAARLARQVVPVGPSHLKEVFTPSRLPLGSQETPKALSSSAEQNKMKQYLLNSVRATEKMSGRGRSSDTHQQALDVLQAQAELHGTPIGSRSQGHVGLRQSSSTAASTFPSPRRRMDRLGKANTFAAGRTPLPKGGVAELLRRGALFAMPDSSTGSTAGPDEPALVRRSSQDHDEDHHSNAGSSAAYSEASSIDLAAAPNGSRHGTLGLRANISFPGLGAAEAGTEANSVARPRVDAAKLALYQSKLNARLDAENEELKKERDVLLQKLHNLENTSSQAVPSNTARESEIAYKEELRLEREKATALDKEAQDLADLIEVKEQEIAKLQQKFAEIENGTNDVQDGEAADLRLQIEELHTLLKERDEDVEDLEVRLAQERQHMEEQVQQAKTYSFETLDKVEAARDQALLQLESLKAELANQKRESAGKRNSVDNETGLVGEKSRDEEVIQLSAQLNTTNTELMQEKAKVGKLNQQLSVYVQDLDNLQADLRLAQDKLLLGEQRRSTSIPHDHVAQSEAKIEQLSARLQSVEHDLATERSQNKDLNQRITEFEVDVRELQEDLNQANEELDEAEQRLLTQPTESADRSKVEGLAAELEEARQQIRALQRNSRNNGLTSNSTQDDRDVEIALLREQKVELEKRMHHYREVISQSRSSPSAVTPSRHSSPLPKSVQSLRNISAVKTPRSPGPLGSASWLYNESSLGAAGVNERIAYLESALDEANASIDAKLQQLDMVKVASDRDRLRAERDEIIQDVAMFETELRRLRLEADQQGQDLEVLRAEREDYRRQRELEDREKDEQRADFLAQVQALVAQLKSKTHEVDRIKTKLDSLERSRSSVAVTAPPPYIDPAQAVSELKGYHEQECKGLMLQIKYLKLRLGREMDLRTDLSHQKQYIGLLLKGLSQADDEVGKIIFDLQIESQRRQLDRYISQKRTPAARWTKVLTTVRAVARMQCLAKKMQTTKEIKTTLQQAHLAVQSRRTVKDHELAFATAKKIRRTAQ